MFSAIANLPVGCPASLDDLPTQNVVLRNFRFFSDKNERSSAKTPAVLRSRQIGNSALRLPHCILGFASGRQTAINRFARCTSLSQIPPFFPALKTVGCLSFRGKKHPSLRGLWVASISSAP